MAEATGIPSPLQRLIFRGRVLRDGHITEHSLEDGACLHLVPMPTQQAQDLAQPLPQAQAVPEDLLAGGNPNFGAVSSHLRYIHQLLHTCLLFNIVIVYVHCFIELAGSDPNFWAVSSQLDYNAEYRLVCTLYKEHVCCFF